MKKFTFLSHKAFLMLSLLCTYGSLLAALPSNDDLANAIDGSSLPFTHTVLSENGSDATLETGENVCNFDASWWYVFTPTITGDFIIKAEVTGSLEYNEADNTSIGIYTGTTHPLTEVGCFNNNNSYGEGERTLINLSSGTTYYIRVGVEEPSCILDVTTSIIVPTPPANDNLANAISVSSLSFTHTVSEANIAGATSETNENICSDDKSWWYVFTPSTTADYLIHAEVVGSDLDDDEDDTSFGIYTGSTHPLTSEDCFDNDDGYGYGERGLVTLSSGTTYYIRVGAKIPLIVGGVTTSIFLPSPPANDNLANAIDGSSLPFTHTVPPTNSSAATLETSEGACDSDASWWYVFTPSSTGDYAITVAVIGSDKEADIDQTSLGVYTGSTHPLTEVGCFDNEAVYGYGERELVNLTGGTTYYIRAGVDDPDHVGDVTTAINATAPPANDDLSNAIVVNSTNFSHTVNQDNAIVATLETGEALCGNGEESWWYQITPTMDGNIKVTSIVTEGITSSFEDDISLGIYTGTTFPLTEESCIDNGKALGKGEKQVLAVTAGTTYYIRVAPRRNLSIQDVVTTIDTSEVLAAEAIPTLSEWGLIILALMFMTMGTLYLVQPNFRGGLEQE